MTLDNDARATIANRSHADRHVFSLHATSTGNGVHLFTIFPAAGRQVRSSTSIFTVAVGTGGLRDLQLATGIGCGRRHGAPAYSVLVARTSILPLDSMACPAIDIEVAPLDANTPLSDAGYEEKIIDALNAALVEWRSDWRQQP